MNQIKRWVNSRQRDAGPDGPSRPVLDAGAPADRAGTVMGTLDGGKPGAAHIPAAG